ncbi:MAG: OprO/OprP family phosphate-selective porin [Bacteroidaceae bacterium]|nr:OprO/OprP family phosphate-selective porin [Bacteroidaceae bacterium]
MNKTKKILTLTLFLLCTTATFAQESTTPQLHGILRGKYEYEPDLDASRFEVRNARLSVEVSLPMRSSYKLEVDLCDESQIKMKDAWVRLNPYKSLRVTIGQQRMPFSIDAHRNPSAQYFANRSFIAKQVGDMRDVGAAVGFSPTPALRPRSGVGGLGRMEMHFDAGIYNGSNLDNQKTAWFDSPAYSARAQFIFTSPSGGKVGAIPSIQHQQIADRKASYTSVDLGAYYEGSGLHLEAEYLHKHYAHGAFDDCNAIDAMAIYKMPISKGYFNGVSYLLRYDYMDNHSDGKKGWTSPDLSTGEEKKLVMSDAERHRMTAGITFHVANKLFPTDLRLNYEKYWYPNNGIAKESEQDKLVAELMVRF